MYENLVPMPQNDRVQIEQVVIEYETDPAKGLAHGVQKDAIQNGFGARQFGNEKKAIDNGWKFHFELLKINDTLALSFWDEGTKGLTGDILTVDELNVRSAEGKLGEGYADQNLSRFLTRFESGGNIGAGSFGRGKLIFQGASKSYSILIDSLRYDDQKYVALERKVVGNQLLQQNIAFVDDAATEFLSNASGGVLQPLQLPGTRITILDVKDEIVEAFLASFSSADSENGYSFIFSKMIEETWWELLLFGADIYLHYDRQTLKVDPEGPLKTVVECKNNEGGFRVHEKENIKVEIQGDIYRIKKLKIIKSDDKIPEEIQDINIQRKRMKVGGELLRGMIIPPKLHGRLSGFIILEPELEDLFEEAEGTIHYGFNRRRACYREIKNIVRDHFETFQESLGFKIKSHESKVHQDIKDVMNEINQHAGLLGLPTDFSTGTSKKVVTINISSFVMPNKDSLRVDVGQKIGPVDYMVTNNTSDYQHVKIKIFSENEGKEDQIHFEKEFALEPKEKKAFTLDQFVIDSKYFNDRSASLLRAAIYSVKSLEMMDQVTRLIWIGIDPKPDEKGPITVTLTVDKFPRSNSRRVELHEKIEGITIKLSNNLNIELKTNFDLLVRRSKSSTRNVKILSELISERRYPIKPLSEVEYFIENIDIDPAIFQDIFDDPSIKPEERKCEIYFSVRSSSNYPDHNIVIGKHIGPKKSIQFFCGVDSAGMSVFQDFEDVNKPDDGSRSDHKGDKISGYTFILNTGHSSWMFFEDFGDEVRKQYIKEQMIYQAYLMSVENDVFNGLLKPYKDLLRDPDMPPAEASKMLDQITGTAINQTA